MDNRCSKCDELKPSTEYYTYLHSTQNKWRTRKVCNSCLKEQKRLYKESITIKKIVSPVVLELQPEVLEPQPVEQINPLSTNPDYKQCRTCQEYKYKINNYYNHNESKKTKYKDCISCYNNVEKNRKKVKRKKFLENNGGSERVKGEVGLWADEYQKEQTYAVLEVLGYKYDEVSGHFLKLGVKEYVDGKLYFIFIKNKRLKRTTNDN